jgi:hypothetical protein
VVKPIGEMRRVLAFYTICYIGVRSEEREGEREKVAVVWERESE